MRRIKKATIKFISLCPRGKNGFATLFKADGSFSQSLLIKGMSDNGELIAVVYAPEKRDSEGDIASAEVIKDMAYEAARSGAELDIKHNEQPLSKDQAFIAEWFIVQKSDPRFVDMRDADNRKVDVTGAWGMVIKIDDPALRELYKTGQWQGVSMGGTALVESEKSESPTGDFEMTLAEMQAALAAANAPLLTAISDLAKAIKPAADPEIVKAEKAEKEAEKQSALKKARYAFKGVPTALNLRKHAVHVAKMKIADDTDYTDPASVAAAAVQMQEVAKEEADIAELEKAEKDAEGDPVAAEVASLKARIDKLTKASRQSTGGVRKSKDDDDDDAKPAGFIGLSKEDEDDAALQAGAAMARHANASRGYK